MQTQDIDTYYLKDLKCETCGEPLRFICYERFSDRKGLWFIVARMSCYYHKAIWVQPEPSERIYLDGPNATLIKDLEDAHNTLSNLAVAMEGNNIPLSWKLSMDFWGFREDFSDALKAKLQILRDFEERRN